MLFFAVAPRSFSVLGVLGVLVVKSVLLLFASLRFNQTFFATAIRETPRQGRMGSSRRQSQMVEL